MNKGYKVQDGCYNCKHCFVMREHDAEKEFYCHIDGSERPPCGSVAMDEWHHTLYQRDQKYEAIHKWDEWAKQHKVDGCGKCDDWERRGNEPKSKTS